MKTELGEELLPYINSMLQILKRADPVQQQQIIEILAARYIGLMHPDDADLVMTGMIKHIKQLQSQFRQFLTR